MRWTGLGAELSGGALDAEDDPEVPSSSETQWATTVGEGEALSRRRVKGKHLDRPWCLTYLRKQGKISRARKNAIRNLWPRYGVDVTTHSGVAGGQPPKLDLHGVVFPHRPPDAPLALEIGFGLGDSLLEMAAAYPEMNFIGVEVHKPVIGVRSQREWSERVVDGEEKGGIDRRLSVFHHERNRVTHRCVCEPLTSDENVL